MAHREIHHVTAIGSDARRNLDFCAALKLPARRGEIEAALPELG
jgi:hypothetical protein